MLNKPKQFRSNINNKIKFNVSNRFLKLEESRKISTKLLNRY